jgi:hypothetical protein
MCTCAYLCPYGGQGGDSDANVDDDDTYKHVKAHIHITLRAPKAE